MRYIPADFDLAPEAICITDLSGRFLDVNEMACALLGYTRGELLQMQATELVDPEHLRVFPPQFEKLLAGEPVRSVRALRRKDGSIRFVEQASRRVGERSVVILRDVTAQAQGAEQERGLDRALAGYRVVQGLLASPASHDAVARSILEAVGEHFGFELVELWLAEPLERALRLHLVWKSGGLRDLPVEALGRHLLFPEGAGIPGEVWRADEPLWISSLAGSPDVVRGPILREQGFRSAAAVPVHMDGEARGALLLASRTPRARCAPMLALLVATTACLSELLERRRTGHDLTPALERNRLEELVAQVPGVVWEAWGAPDAASQRVDFVSQYVETMLGYSVEEWLSTPNFWLQIVHPEDRERAAENAVASFRGVRKGVNQFRWIRKDGRVLDVEAHSTPILDHQNRPLGMRGVTMDITERKHVEEQLAVALQEAQEARARAEEADRAKERFLAVLSHELRQPLGPLQMALELRQKYPEQFSEARAHEVIGRQSAQLARLVEDLLDISRISQGKTELRTERIDLRTVLDPIREAIDVVLREHGLALHYEPPPRPVWVEADRDRLYQVFSNLAHNAIRHSPRGARVWMTLEVGHGWAQVSVRDEGAGMPRELVPKVFDLFARGEGSPGLGVGLAVVRGLVELHGGSVSAHSDGPGDGSDFVVRLPLAGDPAASPAGAAAGSRSL